MVSRIVAVPLLYRYCTVTVPLLYRYWTVSVPLLYRCCTVTVKIKSGKQIFKRVRKIAKANISFVMFVRPSVLMA